VVRGGALVLAASLLLGACGDTTPEPAPIVAGLAELTGPYRAEPFRAFDPALVILLRDACLRDFAGEVRVARGLEPVLVHGRGGGRFMVLLAAPDGEAECTGRLDASGVPSTEGGGSSRDGARVVIGPREVAPGGGGSGSGLGGDAYAYATGRVGSEIGGVVIALADGTSVTASIGGGRFAAWWPGEAQPTRLLGFDRAGNQVVNQSS
jgi:hypothetical protein